MVLLGLVLIKERLIVLGDNSQEVEAGDQLLKRLQGRCKNPRHIFR